jgi:hypothetical protein
MNDATSLFRKALLALALTTFTLPASTPVFAEEPVDSGEASTDEATGEPTVIDGEPVMADGEPDYDPQIAESGVGPEVKRGGNSATGTSMNARTDREGSGESRTSRRNLLDWLLKD